MKENVSSLILIKKMSLTRGTVYIDPALNALLNMDEKGDDAPGMDDAPEEENEGQETSGHDARSQGRRKTFLNNRKQAKKPLMHRYRIR